MYSAGYMKESIITRKQKIFSEKLTGLSCNTSQIKQETRGIFLHSAGYTKESYNYSGLPITHTETNVMYK